MVKRIDYFDVIKTICIFLIIYVHYAWISNSTGSNVTMLITVIGVPLFFMVNGALLLNKKLDLKRHFNKVKLFFVSLIILKLLILLICVVTKKADINNYKIVDIVLYSITGNNLLGIPAEHLWFMYALIKIYLLYPLIYYMFQTDKKYLKYIFIFCLIISFGVEGLNDISLLLNNFLNVSLVDFSAIANSYSPLAGLSQYIVYFILGYYLHNRFYNKKVSKKVKLILIICYFLGLALMFLSRYLQTGYVFNGQFQRIQNDYLKFGTLIMSCSIFILIGQIKLKNYKIFNYIGSKTLNIYYVHMIVLSYAYTYIFPYFKEYAGMKLNFVRTIIVLIISIIITELLRRIPMLKKIFV